MTDTLLAEYITRLIDALSQTTEMSHTMCGISAFIWAMTPTESSAASAWHQSVVGDTLRHGVMVTHQSVVSDTLRHGVMVAHQPVVSDTLRHGVMVAHQPVWNNTPKWVLFR